MRSACDSSDGRERPRIDRFGAAQGLTGNTGLAVYAVAGRPVLVAKQGVFRLDGRGERLLPDTTWQGVSVGGTQDQSAMAEDRQGNVWGNFGLETAVFRRQTDGSYRVDKTALLRFSDMAVAKIYVEDDGVVWFGRDDGLIRFDPSIRQNYTRHYSALDPAGHAGGRPGAPRRRHPRRRASSDSAPRGG